MLEQWPIFSIRLQDSAIDAGPLSVDLGIVAVMFYRAGILTIGFYKDKTNQESLRIPTSRGEAQTIMDVWMEAATRIHSQMEEVTDVSEDI